MDFDAFKKKKDEEKKVLSEAQNANNRLMANGKKSNWIEGIGPASVSNPKVKGFVLGRYKKTRVDPRTLDRPEGIERLSARTTAGVSRRVNCCNERVPATIAMVQCHGCKILWHPQCLLDESEGVCCAGRACLMVLPPRMRSEKDIADEKKRAGVERVKGIRRF